jgi:hypothetical protein
MEKRTLTDQAFGLSHEVELVIAESDYLQGEHKVTEVWEDKRGNLFIDAFILGQGSRAIDTKYMQFITNKLKNRIANKYADE